MKVTLPDHVTGARDALFVLEVEFPVASAERVVEVEASGPVEPLDLSGSSRGGVYRIPVGLERLHVPMRVTEDGEGEATVVVACAEGPEAGTTEELHVTLEAGAAGSGVRWGRFAGVAAAILAVAAVAWGITKLDLFGETKTSVPELANLSNEEAQAKLEDAGLLMVRRYEVVEDEALEGRVVRTVPAAGAEVPDSKSVEVVIGKPDDQITRVPPLVGTREEDAIESLRAARYREVVNYVDVEDPDAVGTVTGQSPEEGEPLSKGAKVEIWVGRAGAGAPTEIPMPPDPGPGVADLPEPPPVDPVPAPGPTDLPEPPPVDPQPFDPEPLDPEPTDPGPGATDVPEPPPVDPQPGPTDIPAPPPVDLEPRPLDVPADVQPLVAGDDGLMTIPDMRGWDRIKAEQDLRAAGLVPIITLEPPPTADMVRKVIRQRPVGGERRGSAAMIFLTVGDGPPLDPQPLDPQPLDPEPLDPQPLDPEPLDPEPADPGPGPTEAPLPPDPVLPDPGPTDPPEPADPLPPDPGPGPQPPYQPEQPPYQPERPSYRPDQPRPVPDVIGETREKAEGLIRQSGFLYHVVLKVTEYPRDGTVLGQDPAPGVTLPPGGEVVLEVAKAPVDAKAVVPRVVGVERDVAERMLREAGFLVNVTLGGGAPNERGLVLDQAPRSETYAPRRSWVEIVVASGSGTRRTARGGPPNAGSTPLDRTPPPSSSSGLDRPSTTGAGPAVVPPSTPRGPAPLPAVELPPRDAPRNASVPQAVGQAASDAIAGVLAAGLIPIIEVDRNATQSPGVVLRQVPAAGTGALPGDLVRLAVATGPAGGRFVNLPTTVGALVPTAQRMFARTNTPVDIVRVRVPAHPYAGTGRVAAQYPVSRVPAAQAGRVTIWIVDR